MKGQSVNIVLAFYAMFIVSRTDAQRTTTVTRTTTTVTTVSVTFISNVVCAKLVNVTGVCRRRRGLPIDEPVVLTFDEELEASVDEAFHHALHPNQFLPTRTLGVEVTPLVLLPVQTPDVNSNDYYQLRSLPGGYSSPSTAAAVRPSITGGRSRNSGRNKLMSSQSDEDEAGPEQKIFFVQIGQLISSIVSQFRPPVTRTTTITTTRTRTTSTTRFSTVSFFVMSCTPSPFPFSVCRAKRSYAD
ncbi:hypothetical protein GHT06_011049 [Daphnia sinensis]|uniref:Uncharacterized protein n=1 Tax=Daphnia sinensis TaxID=1820382 RepID=A0AAD5LK91_9CRUS|nr:hypothetical protein GHT06_011049 [Daphnia sinensis]